MLRHVAQRKFAAASEKKQQLFFKVCIDVSSFCPSPFTNHLFGGFIVCLLHGAHFPEELIYPPSMFVLHL